MMSTPSSPLPLLLDTDVIIDFLRQRIQAKTFISDAWTKGRLNYYWSITVAELYAGIRVGEEAAVTALLGTMISVPLTDNIAQAAGDCLRQFRAQGITLSIPETIVAASAKSIGAELATRNIKHFPMRDIAVIKPYSRP